MSLTPLRLENYFFTRVRTEANLDFASAEGRVPDQSEIEVNTKVEVFRHNEDAARYQLIVTIDEASSDAGQLPYEIEIQAVGFVTVNPGFEDGDVERLVYVNGASMLYTAAREYLLTITGRGPWGGFYLPTTNFHRPAQEAPADPTKQSKRKKKA